MNKSFRSDVEQESARPSDPATHHGRRAMLRKVLAASGVIAGSHFLPGSWVKPVIEKVVLPAHAQTSAATEYFGTRLTQTMAQGVDNDHSSPWYARFMDMIISDARAQGPGPMHSVDFHVVVSGQTANIRFQDNAKSTLWGCDAPLSGGSATPSIIEACWEYGPGQGPQSLRVVNYDLSQMTIAVTGGHGMWSVSVPAGSGTLGPLTFCE